MPQLTVDIHYSILINTQTILMHEPKTLNFYILTNITLNQMCTPFSVMNALTILSNWQCLVSEFICQRLYFIFEKIFFSVTKHFLKLLRSMTVKSFNHIHVRISHGVEIYESTRLRILNLLSSRRQQNIYDYFTHQSKARVKTSAQTANGNA